MKIDTTPLLKSVGRSMKIDLQEEVSFPEDGLNLVAPIVVKGEFLNTGRAILFKGSVESKLLLTCSRCLKEYSHPFHLLIEEEYAKDNPGNWEKRRRIDLTDKDFIFNEIASDNTVDLTEVVRQGILTELPIKPICDEKCNPSIASG